MQQSEWQWNMWTIPPDCLVQLYVHSNVRLDLQREITSSATAEQPVGGKSKATISLSWKSDEDLRLLTFAHFAWALTNATWRHKKEYFRHYWAFVREVQWPPVVYNRNFHILARTRCWTSSRSVSDLRPVTGGFPSHGVSISIKWLIYPTAIGWIRSSSRSYIYVIINFHFASRFPSRLVTYIYFSSRADVTDIFVFYIIFV